MNSAASKELIQNVLKNSPVSLEMPAGTGKTHLLASAVTLAATQGDRSLILTHTNAGVDAIKKRLRKFGVSSSTTRVETITSWAFTLCRSYPEISGLVIPEVPDWSCFNKYLEAGIRVVLNENIQRILRISFRYMFVDEYQDCTLLHHSFILAMQKSIYKTTVLGDRLQSIFGFAGQLVNWEEHVHKNFPPLKPLVIPHRWKNDNEALGQWLLDLRTSLRPGNTIDFSSFEIDGLNFVPNKKENSLYSAVSKFSNYEETVVLLDKWPKSVANHASRLNGRFSVMEELQGRFMYNHLLGYSDGTSSNDPLPAEGDYRLAKWFSKFAKSCIIGLSGLDKTILSRLDQNRTLVGLSRVDIQQLLAAIEYLRAHPNYKNLIRAALIVAELPTLRIYRWEAWQDTIKAIQMTIENGEPPIDNLAKRREMIRRVGRKSQSRIASRTLLVKGLEYDHVIIANLNSFSDPRNLYVALSRAKKSVTILGISPVIKLVEEN